MKILAVDDEKLMNAVLTEEIKNTFPKAEVMSFTKGSEVIAFAKEMAQKGQTVSYAFLDIKLRGMTGLELALEIKNVLPDTKIIFCTGYSEFAAQAYGMYAKGYILKPITRQKIEKTLDEMVGEWKEVSQDSKKNIRIQTFGNFELFVDNKPVIFEREKAKEVLAYLVDRKGSTVTTAELAAVLWEDKAYDSSTRSQTTKAVSSMRKTLKSWNIEDLILKTWNHLALDINKVECDAYDFFYGKSEAVNSYRGEYMNNYSWAEFTNGYIAKNRT